MHYRQSKRPRAKLRFEVRNYYLESPHKQVTLLACLFQFFPTCSF